LGILSKFQKKLVIAANCINSHAKILKHACDKIQNKNFIALCENLGIIYISSKHYEFLTCYIIFPSDLKYIDDFPKLSLPHFLEIRIMNYPYLEF